MLSQLRSCCPSSRCRLAGCSQRRPRHKRIRGIHRAIPSLPAGLASHLVCSQDGYSRQIQLEVEAAVSLLHDRGCCGGARCLGLNVIILVRPSIGADVQLACCTQQPQLSITSTQASAASAAGSPHRPRRGCAQVWTEAQEMMCLTGLSRLKCSSRMHAHRRAAAL